MLWRPHHRLTSPAFVHAEARLPCLAADVIVLELSSNFGCYSDLVLCPASSPAVAILLVAAAYDVRTYLLTQVNHPSNSSSQYMVQAAAARKEGPLAQT